MAASELDRGWVREEVRELPDGLGDRILRVPLEGSVALDSVTPGRVPVTVTENPHLDSTEMGHAVRVTSVPPNTAALIGHGATLIVRPWSGDCQSVQIEVPGGAVRSHEAVGGASLAQGSEGKLEGYLPPHARGAGPAIADLLRIHLGGVASPAPSA